MACVSMAVNVGCVIRFSFSPSPTYLVTNGVLRRAS
jgi:hypothetical protein